MDIPNSQFLQRVATGALAMSTDMLWRLTNRRRIIIIIIITIIIIIPDAVFSAVPFCSYNNNKLVTMIMDL